MMELATHMKNSIGSDPNDWDSDSDGISDGWKMPHSNSENHKIYIDIPSASSIINPDTYYILLEGYNQDHNDWKKITYEVSTTITGAEFLNYFAAELNELGYILHDGGIQETFLASVENKRLIIELQDDTRNFLFQCI